MSVLVLAATLYLQSHIGGSPVQTPTRNDICECRYEQYRWPCSASTPVGSCHLATYSPLQERLDAGFPPDPGQILYNEDGVPAGPYSGN